MNQIAENINMEFLQVVTESLDHPPLQKRHGFLTLVGQLLKETHTSEKSKKKLQSIASLLENKRCLQVTIHPSPHASIEFTKEMLEEAACLKENENTPLQPYAIKLIEDFETLQNILQQQPSSIEGSMKAVQIFHNSWLSYTNLSLKEKLGSLLSSSGNHGLRCSD